MSMEGWKFNKVVLYVSSFLLSLFLLRKSAKLDIFFTIKGTKGSSGKEREVEGESGEVSPLAVITQREYHPSLPAFLFIEIQV